MLENDIKPNLFTMQLELVCNYPPIMGKQNMTDLQQSILNNVIIYTHYYCNHSLHKHCVLISLCIIPICSYFIFSLSKNILILNSFGTLIIF